MLEIIPEHWEPLYFDIARELYKCADARAILFADKTRDNQEAKDLKGFCLKSLKEPALSRENDAALIHAKAAFVASQFKEKYLWTNTNYVSNLLGTLVGDDLRSCFELFVVQVLRTEMEKYSKVSDVSLESLEPLTRFEHFFGLGSFLLKRTPTNILRVCQHQLTELLELFKRNRPATKITKVVDDFNKPSLAVAKKDPEHQVVAPTTQSPLSSAAEKKDAQHRSAFSSGAGAPPTRHTDAELMTILGALPAPSAEPLEGDVQPVVKTAIRRQSTLPVVLPH